MGDPFAVRTFCEDAEKAFYAANKRFTELEADADSCMCSCDVYRGEVDLSMTAYVDDLKRRITDTANLGAAFLCRQSRRFDAILKEELLLRGFHLNQSKADSLICLAEKRKAKEAAAIAKGDEVPAGRPCDELKYLGGIQHSRLSFASELDARCKAMAIAVWSMSKYWGSDTQKKYKRIVFHCKVLNAAVAGLEVLA